MADARLRLEGYGEARKGLSAYSPEGAYGGSAVVRRRRTQAEKSLGRKAEVMRIAWVAEWQTQGT